MFPKICSKRQTTIPKDRQNTFHVSRTASKLSCGQKSEKMAAQKRKQILSLLQESKYKNEASGKP